MFIEIQQKEGTMKDKQILADLQKAMPVPSNVRKGELSTTGLRVSDGHIYEEPLEDFRWPQLLHTCKLMSNDTAIYSANNAIKALVRRIKWRTYTDTDEVVTAEQLEREKFIKSCMHDMEHSWSDFVNESLSVLTYGFSVHEKVYKTRKGNAGHFESKFNDKKVGWAKLPIRSQDTIYRWGFDDKIQRIHWIEQDLTYALGLTGKPKTLNNRIKIPYNKVLHFKHDSMRGNPEGTTPLKACYVPWKYKATIEEFEAIGVSRDMNGMPFIGLPPEYMSDDAPEDKKAVYEYMKNIINNLHMNEQAGLVFPRFIDPETKTNLFEFSLVSVDGNKQFDTDKIINRYENKILMAYLADVLKMGQESTGSFALSDNKTNLMAVGIEAILTEFLEVINRDLIPQTALMNGWDLSQPLPKIGFEDIEERDLEKLGSFIQKTVSTGAMEIDQALSDELRKVSKMPKADESKPVRDKLMTPTQSKASMGATTAGEGTATNPSGKATSSSNQSRTG